MSDVWTPVQKKQPQTPNRNYLVTRSDGTIDILYYWGKGKWEDRSGKKVVAWAVAPEPYKADKKYRWKLNPSGYGFLREAYLVANGVVLMIGEWERPIRRKDYRNVFTSSEFNYMSNKWEFDPDLFIPQEVLEEDIIYDV